MWTKAPPLCVNQDGYHQLNEDQLPSFSLSPHQSHQTIGGFEHNNWAPNILNICDYRSTSLEKRRASLCATADQSIRNANIIVTGHVLAHENLLLTFHCRIEIQWEQSFQDAGLLQLSCITVFLNLFSTNKQFFRWLSLKTFVTLPPAGVIPGNSYIHERPSPPPPPRLHSLTFMIWHGTLCYFEANFPTAILLTSAKKWCLLALSYCSAVKQGLPLVTKLQLPAFGCSDPKGPANYNPCLCHFENSALRDTSHVSSGI